MEKVFDSAGVEGHELAQVLGLAKTNGSNTGVSLKLSYSLPTQTFDPVQEMTTLAGANILNKVIITGLWLTFVTTAPDSSMEALLSKKKIRTSDVK